MQLREACEKASEANREQEASGSTTRYVVVAKPIGSCGGDYQLVQRKIRESSRRNATR